MIRARRVERAFRARRVERVICIKVQVLKFYNHRDHHPCDQLHFRKLSQIPLLQHGRSGG